MASLHVTDAIPPHCTWDRSSLITLKVTLLQYTDKNGKPIYIYLVLEELEAWQGWHRVLKTDMAQ